MSSCLHLALNSKFKPGAEEALRKLGAQLHKDLYKRIQDGRAGLVKEASASTAQDGHAGPVEEASTNLDAAQLQQENTKMKLEMEKMRGGMAYAKSQFQTLKIDRDCKAAEAANAAEQLKQLENAQLAMEEARQESNANLALLESELTSLKESNAALLGDLEELREKESGMGRCLQESQDEIEALRHASEVQSALTTNVDNLNEQLSAKNVELVDLKELIGNKDEEIMCLTTELDEQIVDLDKLNIDLTSMTLEKQSIRDQLNLREAEISELTQQAKETAQERLQLKESLTQANAERDNAVRDKDAIETKMRYAKGQFDKLKKLLEDRGKQLEELKGVDQDLQAAREEVDRLNLQLTEKEAADNYELNDKIGLLESEALSIREQLEESNGARHRLQTELAEASSKMAASDAQVDNLCAELEGFRSHLQNLEEEKTASCNQIEFLKDDIQSMLNERANSDEQRSQLEVTVAQLTRELRERDAALEMGSQDIASLEARLANLCDVEDELRNTKAELDKAGNDANQLMETLAARDYEFSLQANKLANLEAQVLELPGLQKSLAENQAQIENMLPHYQSLQRELAEFQIRVADLEPVAESSDRLQEELQGVLQLLSDTQEEKRQMEDLLKTNESSMVDKDKSIKQMQAELEEAFSIAEMADAKGQQSLERAQQLEGEVRLAQQALLDINDQLSWKEKDILSLEKELSSSHARLESLTKTELELQSANLRLSVGEQELQSLRQEIQHHKAASSRLAGIEQKLMSVECDKTSLMKELEEKMANVERLSGTEQQLQATYSELSDTKNQLSLAQQKVADSEALVVQWKAEQEQGNASLDSFATKCQELQDQLNIAQQEVAQGQTRDEEVFALRQQVLQLETALAVAGSQTAFPPSFDATGKHFAGPDPTTGSEDDINTLRGTSENPLLVKVESLNNQLAEAQSKEMSFLQEIYGLRNELENERRHRYEAHDSIEESSSRPPTSVVINMDGITNKKDEDIHDIEATVLSGGDASGFQPIAGLIRGLPIMKYLMPCIQGSNYIDRGFIVLMRQPALRCMLLLYFMLLHVIAFLFGAS